MVKAKSFIEKFYVAFIGFLLYAPLLVLFVCSFNDSKSRTVWGGFTLHWYTDLFQNEEVLSAVRTSLLLTTLAALIATLIGTLACIGMTAMKLRFQKVMEGLSNIPLLNADIVTGVAIMLLIEGDMEPVEVRKCTDAILDTCSGVAAFFAGNDKDGYKYAIGQREGDVRELVKQVNKELNGRGGGKPFFAQGSLKATRKQIEIFFEKKVNFQ